MGFYLRKSVKVGPLRFNLSKSGVGVSAGLRGLRVGSGPRGNYVHMGRGGLYYRRSTRPGSSRLPPPAVHAVEAETLSEVDSGSVLAMSDSSSASLLEEMNL